MFPDAAFYGRPLIFEFDLHPGVKFFFTARTGKLRTESAAAEQVRGSAMKFSCTVRAGKNKILPIQLGVIEITDDDGQMCIRDSGIGSRGRPPLKNRHDREIRHAGF